MSFLLLASSLPGLGGRWGRSRGQGGAPAAQRGRTTLTPATDPPHTGGRADEVKSVAIQVMCCLRVYEEPLGAGSGRASAQPYLGPRTRVRRHDDGWGARRAGCRRVRPLILSGASTQTAGGDRRLAGAGRGHQLKYGQGTRTTHLGGHPLLFGDRHRQGGIAELTQRVIAAAQDFAFHRQGRVLAVVGGGRPAAGSRRSPGNRGGPRT